MKTRTISAVFLALAIVSGAARAEVVDKVVAVVGNDIITLSDVKQYSAQRSANAKLAQGMPGTASATKDPLEALIREKLLRTEMDRLGVSASQQDIDAALNDVVSRNHITMDILKSELAKKGMSLEKYKKDLGGQIQQMKFLSQVIFPRIKISEDEVARKAGPNPSDQTA
jgi:peptidyl-prolyl cis-trans isomerase SurA